MVERQTPAADDQTTGAREILTRAAGSPGKHFDLWGFRRQGPSRGGDVDRITLTAQTDHNLPTVFHDRFRLSCGIEVRKGNGSFCHGGPYTSTRVTFAGCGGKGRAEVIPWFFRIGSASVPRLKSSAISMVARNTPVSFPAGHLEFRHLHPVQQRVWRAASHFGRLPPKGYDWKARNRLDFWLCCTEDSH